VFVGAREGCISVLDVVFVSMCFEVVYLLGVGSFYTLGMSVEGHVQVPIDAFEPVV
jgi:hypothetical protein